MASRDTLLPRLTQAVDRGHLISTVIKLYGYTVVQQSLVEKSSNAELTTFLSIDGELFHICSPVFKIEDESKVWKLKFEEFNEAKVSNHGDDSVSLEDIKIHSTKVDVTGDPDGSQLRKLCQSGIMEDIKCILKDSKSCNVLLNLCDVPYPKPEDLCDKVFSNLLLSLQIVKKVLVVHPKVEAEICGLESGLEGTWSRYLATDMACLMWKQEQSHFTIFEKKFLKHVVLNGLHEIKKKEQNSLKNEQNSLKKDENSLNRGTNSLKRGMNSLKKGQDTLKREQDSPQKEYKSLKKDQKLVKPEEKSLKKDTRTEEKLGKKEVKPEEKSLKKGAVKSDPRFAKKDQSSPRIVKKLPKVEPKPVRTEKKSLRSDQKSLKGDQKTGKGDQKTAKNDKKTDKNEQPSMNNGQAGNQNKTVDSSGQGQPVSSLLMEFTSHPAFRGFCLALVLLAVYFFSTGSLVTLLLIAASLWFKYGSKKPEFKKYTRSGDPRVLAFRGMYEREIEKMRYAKDQRRMRDVHIELKESVLNAYAVNRVSSGDIIGVEEHEELERELELTFKEFVTENDVKNLLHEAHYTSFVLALTVFLYLTSRVFHVALGKVWRPIRTVAIILSAILLSLSLYVVTNFLSASIISSRLIGSAEMLCLVFGLWFVTDVTGVLIEIRACIDHMAWVVWREVELEKCILKCPSYLVVKLALDCSVILSLFPVIYASSWILSIFSVSAETIYSVSVYFPVLAILLRVSSRLAFFGEILRLANLIMFASLASKFYGLHKKRGDPLDDLLYNLFGYDLGSVTEYTWKPLVKYLNDLS